MKFDEDHKAGQLEDFAELGIDVRFREPKMAAKDGSIRSSYYPTLFGDDGFESTKYDLLKRVERETRVMPIKDLDHYLTREAQAIKKTEELASRPVDPSYKPPYLRSKIAFKDMCSHKKDPILIRTRDGRCVVVSVSVAEIVIEIGIAIAIAIVIVAIKIIIAIVTSQIMLVCTIRVVEVLVHIRMYAFLHTFAYTFVDNCYLYYCCYFLCIN